MVTVGAYEAKTHLPQLLERVARGERIVITRHGVPVAELAPVGGVDLGEQEHAIERLKTFRRGHQAGGTLRAMIDEGRR